MDALLAYNSDTDNSGGDSSHNRDDSILPTVNDSVVELEGGLRVASSCKKSKIVHEEEDASNSFSSALFKRNLESNEKRTLTDRIPELFLQKGTSVVFSSAKGSGSGDNAGISRSILKAGEINAPKASDHLLPEKTGKAKIALPLPSDLDQLFAAGPSRIRSFPHVDGNFAVHVYAPVTFSAAAKLRMAAPLEAAESAFPSLMRVDKGGGGSAAITADSHVSLSRSCAIRFQQIESLVALLKHGFLGQHMYQLEFDSWQAFVNEGKTRSFLALEATGSGVAEFTRQVALVDSAYTRHELPPFHKTPRPHISLMWTLGDATRELTSFCDSLNDAIKPSNGNVSLTEDMDRKCASSKHKNAKAKEKSATWRAHVTQVVCKVGQREHCVWQVH